MGNIHILRKAIFQDFGTSSSSFIKQNRTNSLATYTIRNKAIDTPSSSLLRRNLWTHPYILDNPSQYLQPTHNLTNLITSKSSKKNSKNKRKNLKKFQRKKRTFQIQIIKIKVLFGLQMFQCCTTE